MQVTFQNMCNYTDVMKKFNINSISVMTTFTMHAVIVENLGGTALQTPCTLYFPIKKLL